MQKKCLMFPRVNNYIKYDPLSELCNMDLFFWFISSFLFKVFYIKCRNNKSIINEDTFFFVILVSREVLGMGDYAA